MASKVRPRGSKLDYKLLHNGTFVKLDKRTVSKRTPHVLEETFYVERIIWRKEDSKEYLIKWVDYGTDDCTWEPEQHIPPNIVNSFVPTQIEDSKLRYAADVFDTAIQSRLKSRNPLCRVDIAFDIFRYVFGPETTVICGLSCLEKLPLPENWYYNVGKDGNGKKIPFPLKITVRLRFRKMYVKVNGQLVLKSRPIERWSILSATEACCLQDI